MPFNPTDYAPCESPIEKQLYDAFPKWLRFMCKPQYELLGYRVDFAILPYKIIVECDGEQWHKERFEEDSERDRNLILEGWTVIRFTGSHIFNNANECVDYLVKLCNKRWYYILWN